MTATTSRRSLLTAFAGILAVAALPGGWVARMVSTNPVDSLLQRLHDAESALAIAAIWNSHQVSPADPDELRAALLRHIGPRGERLHTAIADDFGNCRMILVEGWPVAESEARLCALAQLTRA